MYELIAEIDELITKTENIDKKATFDSIKNEGIKAIKKNAVSRRHSSDECIS